MIFNINYQFKIHYEKKKKDSDKRHFAKLTSNSSMKRDFDFIFLRDASQDDIWHVKYNSRIMRL